MKLQELKEIVDECRDHFGVVWQMHFTCTWGGGLAIQIHVPEMTRENMALEIKIQGYLKENIVGKKVPIEIVRNEAGVVI